MAFNALASGNAGDIRGSTVQKIAEEEELDVTSPTDLSFRGAKSSSSSSSTAAAERRENESFFRHTHTGAGGQGIVFGTSPFGGGDDEIPPPNSSGSGSGGGGFPSNYALGRRTSVSAESINPASSASENWSPPFHHKTDEQLSRLKAAVGANFLFSHLDDEQFKTVLNALVEKPIPAPGIKVVTQGDAGDYFYIVEQGNFDVYIHPSGTVQSGGQLGNKVSTIGPGGSFGELALMYNAPRAATVVSIDPRSTLWALDRMTFRRIIMDSAFQRRQMYESFLEEVPLLSSLKPYERSKIADALDALKYSAGSSIINEGDPGTSFYLLESGEAEAFKDGAPRPVKAYKRGDYFGELALLDDKPRAATVVAKTDVKVARLGRDGFKRLLGPVEQIMRRTDYQPAQ